MRFLTAMIRASIWAVGLAVAGGNAPGAPEPPAMADAAAEWATVRDETFRVVWETVNESYFDPGFGGVDWVAVGERYRQQLAGAADKPALRELLTAMLGELRKTHFAIQPREMAVFTPEERSRAGTVGLDVAATAEGVAVVAVAAGSAAEAAGIRPGDLVQAVAGQPVAVWRDWLEQAELTPARRRMYLVGTVEGHLRGSVGSTVTLTLARPGAEDRTLELEFAEHAGEWSEPMGNFPSLPVMVRGECGADGIAYLHFNVFARAAMPDIRALLRQVPAGGGLVIDLRGNGGGLAVMASGLSGWLSDHRFQLGAMMFRQGHIGFTVTPQTGAFLGPLALLMDSGSASTSEIMAAGLQEAGRARIFGEPSPGAALPSLFKVLPTGDLLQHAVADMQTPKGVAIEGRGVTPDEVVLRSAADLARGRDPVLEAARLWIEQERARAGAATTSAP